MACLLTGRLWSLSVVSTERSARGIPERKIIRGSTVDFTGLEMFYRMAMVGKICMYWIVYGFIHADGAFKKIEVALGKLGSLKLSVKCKFNVPISSKNNNLLRGRNN